MAEARAVFGGADEGFDHLGPLEVAAVVVELPEPEVVAAEVRVGAAVRVAPEISEVLHQDEGAVELLPGERRMLGNFPEHTRARLCGVVRRAKGRGGARA